MIEPSENGDQREVFLRRQAKSTIIHYLMGNRVSLEGLRGAHLTLRSPALALEREIGRSALGSVT